jgi:hypothetical protein
VAELTGLLRQGRAGDQLESWPASMRVFARRERPHPGAQPSLFEAADGWRYSLWATNLPERTRGWRGQAANIDAAGRLNGTCVTGCDRPALASVKGHQFSCPPAGSYTAVSQGSSSWPPSGESVALSDPFSSALLIPAAPAAGMKSLDADAAAFLGMSHVPGATRRMRSERSKYVKADRICSWLYSV